MTTMTFKTLLVAVLASLLLSACGTPKDFADRRARHNAGILPDPADRVGIHLAFPFSDILLVTYFADQISEEEAVSRFTTFCAHKEPGSQPVKREKDETEDVTVQDEHGNELPAKRMIVECRSAS
ncbi:hypothetical protein [Coralliovum pocilloporae]|uniref:hypothetical protein n=1 Tax=Coralliovum pocilloporae TaxID=3066369 RepID=UPI003307A283